MEDVTYPLLARGAAAKVPPRKRKIRRDAVFGATAHPIWNAVYTTKLPMNMGLRPTCSDNGPQTRGPTQYPATKSAIVNVATSVLRWKWGMSCVMMPDGAEDVNVL